jgi:uncharacterized SAM-binding protein YcdF (DUF218 family)
VNSAISKVNSPRKLFGIINRRLRWGLSWRGWLLVVTVTLAVAYLLVKTIHPFLAVSERVDADTLVVEGWIHRYALGQGAEEFKTGSYQRIFTTGGPENGSGGYTNDYNTSASVGADILTKRFGVPSDQVQMVPSHVVDRDRTYSSAVALRNWFHEHDVKIHRLNVLTEDAHARRTRLLFAKALGPDVEVGVIAARNPDYDTQHWWRYSEGVEEVIGESIAYLYAKFFFHPPKAARDGERVWPK